MNDKRALLDKLYYYQSTIQKMDWAERQEADIVVWVDIPNHTFDAVVCGVMDGVIMARDIILELNAMGIPWAIVDGSGFPLQWFMSLAKLSEVEVLQRYKSHVVISCNTLQQENATRKAGWRTSLDYRMLTSEDYAS